MVNMGYNYVRPLTPINNLEDEFEAIGRGLTGTGEDKGAEVVEEWHPPGVEPYLRIFLGKKPPCNIRMGICTALEYRHFSLISSVNEQIITFLRYCSTP